MSESSSSPSQWVLRVWEADMPEWVGRMEALRDKPLRDGERELVLSFTEYLKEHEFLTPRQLEVLRRVAGKYGVELPPIPRPSASSPKAVRRRRFLKGTLYSKGAEHGETEQSRQFWFDEYVKPLPTWVVYDPHLYRLALGKLVAKPPSEKLAQEAKYVAGFVEADGWFGYVVEDRDVVIPRVGICLHQKDRDVLNELAALFNVAVTPDPKRAAVDVHVAGLRGYLVVNLIHPYFKSARRIESSKFMVEKGYHVTESELKKFRELYKPTKKHVVEPVKESPQEEVLREAWVIEACESVEVGGYSL